jgi:WD40 repeat protein
VVSALQAVLPARLLRASPGHSGGAFGAAWERSGARLATAGADRTVKLWDAEGHHVITLQVRVLGACNPLCRLPDLQGCHQREHHRAAGCTACADAGGSVLYSVACCSTRCVTAAQCVDAADGRLLMRCRACGKGCWMWHGPATAAGLNPVALFRAC